MVKHRVRSDRILIAATFPAGVFRLSSFPGEIKARPVPNNVVEM